MKNQREKAVKQVGNIVHTGNFENPQRGRIYSKDGCSPALNCCGGGGLEPKVLIPQSTQKGYIECNIPGVCDLTYPNSKTRRGRVQDGGETCPTLMGGTQDICAIELPCIAASRGRNIDNPSDRTPGNTVKQRIEFNKNGTSNTITTVQKDNYVVETSVPFVDKKYKQFQDKNGYIPEMFNPYNCAEIKEFAPTQLAQGDSVTKSSTVLLHSDFRIRKLTPLECWRLMGFTDEQFRKAAEVNSNSQLYKQAGNSIVVDVLYYLFKNLFIDNQTEKNIDILQSQISLDEYLGG